MSLMIVAPCVAGGDTLFSEALHGAGDDALLSELSMEHIVISAQAIIRANCKEDQECGND